MVKPQGAVARWSRLTLNRPEKLNALAVEMFRRLRKIIEEVKHDESIRCVVLHLTPDCSTR